MEIRESLTFDDVLLVPKHSTGESRSKVDLSCYLFETDIKIGSIGIVKGGFAFKHPIIPANMKTVTGYEMAREIYKSGGLAIVHRFMSTEEQIEVLNKLEKEFGRMVWVHVGLSVGVKAEDFKIVDTFVQAGVEILCVDIAHGDSDSCVTMCRYIKEKYPEVLLIAGNVATAQGAKNLWLAGADFVKVGIGPGSLCTTRLETGNGVPQLTALMDVAKIKYQLQQDQIEFRAIPIDKNINYGVKKAEITRPIGIIADGGIKNAGDCVKALCFADMVMTGNLFAGAEETPGEKFWDDGKLYKQYVGSSTHKTNRIEGVAARVPVKGNTKDILTKLLEGIQSGCSYQGVNNLVDLKKNPEFIRITNAGLKESHPHDVLVKG